MNMARSDSLSAPRSLTVRRVDGAESATAVRHVDELDEGTLSALYDAVEYGRPIPAAETDLEAGEVVVFTDYVRVERR